MVMNCHKIWSDIKLVPSCISFHTYFIKFHIPLSLYSFCGSKTADTNELVFTSELTDEKLVRDWRRKIDNIKSLPRTKCADRGRKCQWPELEKKVVEWVEENRKSGLAVTRNLIRLHAKKTAQQMNIDNFLISSGWCTRFMKRNKLVLRQKTKMSQRLPDKPRPTSGCLFKQAIQGSFTGKMDDLDDE